MSDQIVQERTVSPPPALEPESQGRLPRPLLWIVSLPKAMLGPILDKEMRVSSRRKRNYWLRLGYLLLLIVFVGLFWAALSDQLGGHSAADIYRLSQVGMGLTTFVVWFQFIALQLVTVAMLSTSISDEIYKRTLGVLMTTPITSLQIVLGKLSGKLLQLLMLLALSLPLLAVVRVFGGVPMGYLISGFCITLTSVLFVASLTMFYSISTRHAHNVIFKTLLALFLLFAVLPALTGWILSELMSEKLLMGMMLFNPWGMLSLQSMRLALPGAVPQFVSWELHCLIMLGVSAGLLAWCTARVRKVAIRQAMGDISPTKKRKAVAPPPAPLPTGTLPPPLPQAATAATLASLPAGPPPLPVAAMRMPPLDLKAEHIRPVGNRPMIWKETRSPIIRGWRAWTQLGICSGILLISYMTMAARDSLSHQEGPVTIAVILAVLAIINTLTVVGTPITIEKESRSMAILLLTTLSNWQIVWAKLLGAMRKTIPSWTLLLGHVLLFTLGGIFAPFYILQLVVIMGSWAFMIGCMGMYCGALVKTSSAAVILTMAAAIMLWVVGPVMIGLAGDIDHGSRETLQGVLNVHPAVQLAIVTEGSSHDLEEPYRDPDGRQYHWFGSGSGLGETNGLIGLFAALHVGLGMILLTAAKARLRSKIY